MAEKLTAKAIESLKPGIERREIADGHTRGLYFVLQPTGKASWAVRYRAKGTRVSRKLTLGPYPAISLADARVKASKALISVAEAGDPAAEKQAARRAARASSDTIEAVLDRFVERYLRARGLRSAEETKRILDANVVAAWRHRPLASIARKDVHELLDGVMDRGSPIMANRVFAAFRKLCAWAVERGIIDTSPCAGIKPPASERSRDRVLDDDELVAVWRACDVIGGPFVPLIKLMVLTGQRRDEVASMRWPEVDLEARTWTIPKERAKNGVAHIVPLSAPAVALIRPMLRIEGKEQFVFTTSGVTALSGFSRAKDRVDAAIAGALAKERPDDADAKMPPWRLHDLRRSFASGCARLGVSLPVIERALNHVSGSFKGIVGVYQRHDFLAERRAAMDAWARHVEGIVAGESGKVIELAAVRS